MVCIIYKPFPDINEHKKRSIQLVVVVLNSTYISVIHFLLTLLFSDKN